ncbi:hypothetical protein [Pseudomonas syringae]|uniref:hypothetical protein n=1 Tax=Pseudomonas syringae TaxID=317 RepID=UPI00206A72B1|nr:hypothetical protein [Pseudomonas syringae]BBI43278.1 hypothetical protein KPSA1B_102004 [Pseudomonas syringae pv. actinidiae]
MTFSIPWGMVAFAAGWCLKKVEKALFYNTYLQSHRSWTSKHSLGSFWEPLGEHLEYSVYLAESTDALPQESKIALRAKQGALNRFEGVFEGRGMWAKYQDRIIAVDVDATPAIFKLNNQPVCELVDVTNDRIRFSLDTYRLRHCRLELSDGRNISMPDGLTQNLTQTSIWNSKWSKRWGRDWNLDALKFAKQELEIYWRWFGTFSYSGMYVPVADGGPRHAGPLVRTGAKAIGWVMSTRWLVTAQFWLAIWSGLWVLDQDDRVIWRWKKP